jgi:hypothetical protein
MCGKKSRHGLKSIVVLLVLLALALQPLAAWKLPDWLTGGEKEQLDSTIQTCESKPEDLEKIQLLQQSIADYETQLKSLIPVYEGYVKLETELQTLLEEKDLWLGDLQTSIESLVASSQKVTTLVPIAQEIQEDLKTDYDVTVTAYEEKAEESDEYFKALADSEAKLAAVDRSKWSGTFGASALFSPDTMEYGVSLEMGIGYDAWNFKVGADYYIPTGFSLSGFGLKDLDYRAGLTFTF